MLGDAGTDNAAYDGVTGDSPSVFSLDYYRQKATEFQTILNQVDATAQAAQNVIDAGIDNDLSNDLVTALSEFDAKKAVFRMTAEAINAAAAFINSAGGRFPSLSIPTGLGFAPIVLPAAGIAAIATAATLIVWGVSWINGVKERMRLAQLMSVGTPEQQAELARSIAVADNAQRTADASPLSSVASVVKWGAIGLGLWLAYRAWSDRRG